MAHHKTESGTSYWIYNNEEKKPVIIMIHGFRGTHHGLEPVAENLPDYKIIIPDLPGFGETKPLETGLSLDSYISWLHDFLSDLQLKSRPVLLGHSFGSIIASHYAAKYQNAISKLILENPIGSPALEGPRVILTKLALMYYWLGFKLPEPFGTKLISSKLVARVMSKILIKTSDKEISKFIKSQGMKHSGAFADKKSVNEAFQTSVQYTVREVANTITIPTLLIASDRDDVTALDKQYELLNLFKDAQINVINNVGHLTQYESPKLVACAITDFLD